MHSLSSTEPRGWQMRWNATTCLARLARAGGVVILVEQTLENSALNFRRHLLAAGISRKHDHDFMKHTLHSKVSTSLGCQTLQRMRHTTMLSFQFFLRPQVGLDPSSAAACHCLGPAIANTDTSWSKWQLLALQTRTLNDGHKKH